jgi:hypothetical protein
VIVYVPLASVVTFVAPYVTVAPLIGRLVLESETTPVTVPVVGSIRSAKFAVDVRLPLTATVCVPNW